MRHAPRIPLVLVLAVTTPLAIAQCIEVQDRRYDLSTNNIGSAVVEWQADLKNRCRKTLDADLTIQLLDGDRKPVYEMLDKTTLEMEELREVVKEVYVPRRIVDQVQGIAIEIVERERQF